jgi:zinc transporter ZupT
MVGASISLLVGSNVESFSAPMLPFTAGGFFYVVGPDLLPELNKALELFKSVAQLLAMGTGVGLMLLLMLLLTVLD